MHRSVIHLAAVLGVVLALLFASSIIAWRAEQMLDPGPVLGTWFYDPTLAWRWWWVWGHDPAYRAIYMKAAWLILGLAALPLLILRIVEVNTDLRPGIDPGRRDGFGRVHQLLKTGRISAAGDGVVIGKSGRRILRDHGDGHILIMGPSRLGKGAGHVVPTLLTHRGPMLINDPKHELEKITGRYRRSLGPVHVVDPTNPEGARFNPLLEVRGDGHMIADCQNFAFLMVKDLRQAEDPFWDKAARDIVTALLVHVARSEERTLGHLWRLVLGLKNRRYPASSFPFVRDSIRGHRELEGRVRDSINATLITHLSFLADPLIQQTTSASDFRAGDLMCSDRPTTVFLSVPVSDGQRLRLLTALTLESMITALTHDQNVVIDGRRKRWPLLAMIDEFPQLGRLDVFERKLPIMAGYGVRLALVCQDEDQIAALYGQRQSITANCSTICAIAGFSSTSLQTMERWGGKHAVRQRSKQLPGGIRGSASVSQSETRMQLLEAGEMLQRSAKEVLIFTHGVAPTWLPKVRYWKEREYRGRFDQQAGEVPSQTANPTPRHSNAPEESPSLTDEDQELLDGVEDLIAQLPDASQQALLRKYRDA